jgi:hypothetical protein
MILLLTRGLVGQYGDYSVQDPVETFKRLHGPEV